MEDPMYREIPKHLTRSEQVSCEKKKMRDELEEYRKNHPKPWYLLKQKSLNDTN